MNLEIGLVRREPHAPVNLEIGLVRREPHAPVNLEIGLVRREPHAPVKNLSPESRKMHSNRKAVSFTIDQEQLVVDHAVNDLVFDPSGKPYIDLFTGCGTTFLGHAHPQIVATVQKQIERVWVTGRLPTDMYERATTLIESYFPASHQMICMYSTGMESAEFSLRVARVQTGRRRFIGFDRCMHGKSMATAFLGWQNEKVDLPDFIRLPFLPDVSEHQLLELLAQHLAGEQVAAVVIEPFQGSGGGHIASAEFHQQLASLCAKHGTLLVVDEIFTGFHRTGPAFVFKSLGIDPDIVLFGKAIGNGFPVSAAVATKGITVTNQMLPGSTYAGNPLAAAAIVGTLEQMAKLDMANKVAEIERTICAALAPLQNRVTVRGRGALWVLEVAPAVNMVNIVNQIFRGGVLVSPTSRFIRLLPAATISLDRLSEACKIVCDACLQETG